MSSPQQESFQSMATVFILQDKTWIERGHGLVRFVFDLRTFALRLVIRPGTPEEFECKLRPRIRSKGPRAYVVRAQAENGADEHILAVRFEREEDSRSFRRFVEKRDVDHTKGSSAQNAQQTAYVQQREYNNSGIAQQSAYRHHGRNSNVSPGYYPGGQPAPQYRDPQVNSNLASQYNQVSAPVQKSHHVQAGYFWTCSRCLQMVDPTLHTCHVCGTPRRPPASGMQQAQVLQQISPNPAYQQQQHQHQGQDMTSGRGGGHNPYGQQHYGSMAAQEMRNPGLSHYVGSGRHGQSSSKQHHPATILKLTTVNLEKHNKLFPPKRRNVKEIVITQVDWLRKHGHHV